MGDIGIGSPRDPAAASDTDAAGLVGLMKRLLGKLTAGVSVILTPAGTATDRSGTITAGGTRQQLAAANSSRRYLIVQNQSSGYLYVRFTATATQDQSSMRLAPGDAWESPSGFCPTQAVDIVGATTGQAWYAVEG